MLVCSSSAIRHSFDLLLQYSAEMYTKLQLVNTQTPERWVQPMAPSEWPLSRVLADWLLAFSGKQPLHRFSELATDPQQNLRPNFLFATFHIKRDAPNLLQSV